MIEIRITKEISDYEPKLFGPLTLRQSACVAIGAPFCYLIIRYLGPLLTKEVAMFSVSSLRALPMLLAGPDPTA